jgi:hypothetical protein
MPRKPAENRIVRAVRDYIALAENASPAERPLDVRSVARIVRTSPTTLYKYGLQELIKQAARRQKTNSTASPAEQERRAYEERLQALRDENEELHERNRGLLAHIALLEGNAARLGIDPEDLCQAIVKPDRRVSRAGKAQPAPNGRTRRPRR